MKISRLPKRILFGALVSLAAFIGTGGLAYAQEQQSGVPVQIVVTAMPRSKAPATKLTPQNLMVSQGHYTNQIVSVESAQGSQAGVQLLLLIDDSDRTTAFATQLNDLRSFISNQPPNVMIGVAYMFNGAVKMYQDFTTDHSAAAQTVRLPGGLAVGSDPYDSLTDVIQHWPTAANSRRAILMISNGIDPYGTGDAQDPNIKQVIRRAQIAGIQVFTIYTGSERIGRGLFPGAAYWGSVYLQMLSEQTGAEAYNSGLGPPVSYSPFLDNLGFSLQHQYLVTILVHPGKKPGMQKIKVKSGADVKLRAPSEVFVPAVCKLGSERGGWKQPGRPYPLQPFASVIFKIVGNSFGHSQTLQICCSNALVSEVGILPGTQTNSGRHIRFGTRPPGGPDLLRLHDSPVIFLGL